MTRTWFASELETVAAFWRVLRSDGLTLGFTSHDRDLWFDGVLHQSSPGMVPYSIKRTADFEPDSAEVEGALTHDTINAADLSEGRYDGAQVRIGIVDWEIGETEILYRGSIGAVLEQDGSFTAELVSRKAELFRDPVPRTSPGCRAQFCGPGCDLSPPSFTHEGTLGSLHADTNSVVPIVEIDLALLLGGWLHWLDGPQAGIRMNITALTGASLGGTALVLDMPIDPATSPGSRIMLRQGCDHTLGTCASRFKNAVNFRGEPFLPGNDLLTRYPAPAQ